jgi:hypothetical protein
MRGPSSRFAWLAVVLVACARNPAPVGWQRPPEVVQHAALGAWITVQCVEKREPCAEGELIAVDEDRFRVLTAAGLEDVEKQRVAKATLVAYTNKRGSLGTWVGLGTLSTLSHGALLLVTAPVWIATGIAVTADESRAPLVRYPERPIQDFRPHARFPQGLPPGLDGAALGALREPANP